jgi:hypothetical protein
MLLLVAAALKVYGWTVAPISATGIFSAPDIQVALVNGEIFLGLWLLSGKQPVGAWFAALAAFACFAVASFSLGWIGQASCGCFGELPLNPWYAFCLEIVVIAALLGGRPDLKLLWRQRWPALASAGRIVGGGGLALSGMLLAVVLIASGCFRLAARGPRLFPRRGRFRHPARAGPRRRLCRPGPTRNSRVDQLV